MWLEPSNVVIGLEEENNMRKPKELATHEGTSGEEAKESSTP